MDTYSKERIEVLLTNVYNCKHANLDIDPLCVYFVSLLFLYLSSVTMHRDHILTSDLREAFDYLVNAGETSSAFDVRENVPKGKNRKKSVNYYYAGRRTFPFAFIVNSGERKDYHLFYIRNPKRGDLETVKMHICDSKVSINPREEITVQVHNRQDAESVWRIVEDVRLK